MSTEKNEDDLTPEEQAERRMFAAQMLSALFGMGEEPEPEPESVTTGTEVLADVIQDITAMSLGVHARLLEGGVSQTTTEVLTAHVFENLLHRAIGCSNG